jgi:ABC-type Fe3+-hydroxamate transport system substrate-binding protein
LHPQTTRKDFLKRLGWQGMAASRSGRIYDDVNPDILFRPGPRIVDGIEAIAQRLGETAR